MILLEHTVANDGLVLFGTEDETDGGIIAFTANPVFEQPHIHIHLADILMGQLAHLEVNQHKTLEEIIVEHQIDEEMLGFGTDPVLPADEREAFAQFQQKPLQVQLNSKELKLLLLYFLIRSLVICLLAFKK